MTTFYAGQADYIDKLNTLATVNELAGLEGASIAILAPIAGDISTVASISTNVSALGSIAANITTLAPKAADIAILAPKAANIATLAPIAANITSVANISTNVTTVATNLPNINTVAGISANVAALGPIAANITTLSPIAANINTVAGISANITALSPISTNITSVAGISTNVTTVATNLTNINTVAGISSNITTVSTNLPNINTVAGVSSNITTLAPIVANITSVAGISANVTTVATNIANVNTAAANITNINNASTYATNANTSATLAQNWATQLVTPVAGGEYSAKYWAQQAAASITGSLVYKGSWSAATTVYPSTPAIGDYYKVSLAGTTNSIVYDVNDSIIYNGTTWDKIDSTDSVASVAGKVGAVTLVKGDVGLSNIDNTTDIDKPISTLQQTALNLKQDTLVSGTNIKTVNGGSLLGSGDLEIVGGLAPTTVKTANYTALVNDLVLTNSTAAGFTVTLPSAPVEGDKVGLLDTTNTCSTNPVTIAVAGGKTIEGDPTALEVNISGAYIELLYTGTNWKLLDTPVRQDFQETLVSGTSIKTIGGQSLLGSGDIAVSGGSSSGYEQTFLMMGA